MDLHFYRLNQRTIMFIGMTWLPCFTNDVNELFVGSILVLWVMDQTQYGT